MALTYAEVREWVLSLPGGAEVMVEKLVKEYDAAR